MQRKTFLKSAFATFFGLSAIENFGNNLFANNITKLNLPNLSMQQILAQSNTFTLPALPYSTDALEPHFDKLTMEIHHGRHHKAYVDNLNKNLVGTAFENTTMEAMFKQSNKLPDVIKNNAGGHWNHSFFWNTISPNAQLIPTGPLLNAINSKYGSFEKFKEEFAKAATGRFGSGWAWLVLSKKGLEIGSTPNQDNPLMKTASIKGTPIIGLDVWEHAYYLKYQNKRADYIKAYWNVINWAKASEDYATLIKS